MPLPFIPAPIVDHPGLVYLLANSVGFWEADFVDNIVTSGNMETLVCKAGTGNDPTQGTEANRPTVTTVGNNTFMDFNTGTDILTETAPTAALQNNFDTGGCCIYVGRMDNAGETAGRIYDKNGTFDFLAAASAGNDLFFRVEHATTDTDNQLTAGPGAGNIAICDARYDASLIDNSDIVMGVDGTESTVGAGITALAAPAGAAVDNSGNDFSIGNRLAGDRAFNGLIGLLAILDVRPVDSDMLWIRKYCSAKYNIALS